MTTIIKSVEINATRDTIRQYYAHPKHTPQWAHTITKWEMEEVWPRVGSTAKLEIKSGGIDVKGIATTVAYDDETMAHQWHFVPDNGMPPFDCWYMFDEEDGKTTVTAKVEYTVPGSFLGKALDKLFVERENNKDVQQQLVKLKALAEADSD